MKLPLERALRPERCLKPERGAPEINLKIADSITTMTGLSGKPRHTPRTAPIGLGNYRPDVWDSDESEDDEVRHKKHNNRKD